MNKYRFLSSFYFTFLLTVNFSCSTDRNEKNNIEGDINQTVKVGEKAPDYLFNKVINFSKESLSVSEFKGKPLIIEFWATWCRPCIPAMTKLDSLQQLYQDEVAFITVSPESRTRLEKFITNTANRLPIAVDTSYHKLFPPYSIPRSVLIDRDGIVRLITSPKKINSETVDELIAGEKFIVEQEETSNAVILKEIYDEKKQITLKSYDASSVQYRQTIKNIEGEVNGYTYCNYTLPSIFQEVFDISIYSRLIFMDGLTEADFSYDDSNNKYVLTVEIANGLESEIKAIAAEFMNTNFEIFAEKAVKEMDCYVLTVKEKVLLESRSKEEKFEFRGDRFIATNQKLKRLIRYLENMQNIIIADKTSLNGLYDIELEWEYENPETLHKALAKYGLELKKSEEQLFVEVLEIHKKS